MSRELPEPRYCLPRCACGAGWSPGDKPTLTLDQLIYLCREHERAHVIDDYDFDLSGYPK